MPDALSAGARAYAELDARARDRGLTMAAVATGMGWSRSLFWRWQHGASPRWENVMAVHTYLNALPLRDTAALHAELLS